MASLLEAKAVDELIDTLDRDEGWTITTSQRIAVANVLIAASVQPELIGPGGDIGSLVAPVICTSPRQQTEFRERLKHVLREQERKQAPLPGPKPNPERKRTRRALWDLLALTSTLAVILAGILIYIGTHRAIRPDTPPVPVKTIGAVRGPAGETRQQPAPLPTGAASPDFLTRLLAMTVWARGGMATALAALLLAAGMLVTRLTAQHELTKVFEKDSRMQHHFPRVGSELVVPAQFRAIAQQLRRRRYAEGTSLDLPRSVRATVRRGGFFTPIYATRGTVPEYAVLIDRATTDDQQAVFYNHLLDRLHDEDVYLTRYEFRGDPRLCWRPATGEPLSLEHLVAKHHGDFVMLLADPACFLGPFSSEIAPWAKDFFAALENVAILTSAPLSEWGRTESALAALGVMILPASMAGIASYAEAMSAQAVVPGAWGQLPPLPPVLRNDPEQWLSNSAPAGDLIEQLIAELEVTLTPSGLTWLAACAVYPAVDWYVTLHLGSALKIAQVEGDLLMLLRLPWFRRGTMPDWLRLRLIELLPRRVEEDVRRSINTLFRDAVRRMSGGGSKLRLVTYRDIVNSVEDGSPLREYVLARFMERKSLRPLNVVLPEIFSDVRAALLRRRRVQKDPAWQLIAAYVPLLGALFVRSRREEVRWHARNGTGLFLAALVTALAFMGVFARLEDEFKSTYFAGAVFALYVPSLVLAVRRALRGDRLRVLGLSYLFADPGRPRGEAGPLPPIPAWQAFVAYFSILPVIVLLFGDRKDKAFRWHCRNGLSFFAAYFSYWFGSYLIGLIPGAAVISLFSSLFTCVMGLAYLAIWIIAMIRAAQGSALRIPFFWRIAGVYTPDGAAVSATDTARPEPLKQNFIDSEPYAVSPGPANAISRLIGVISSPDRTFASIARNPDWVVPLLLFLALSTVNGIVVSQIAEMSELTASLGSVMALTAPVFLLAGFLAVAAILMLVYRSARGAGRFKQYFSVTLYAWLPLVIQSLFLTLVLMSKKTLQPDESLIKLVPGNFAFLTDVTLHPVLFYLLASLDAFTFWALFLMALGFAHVSLLSKRKSTLIVVGLWLVWTAFKVGITALGAAGSL